MNHYSVPIKKEYGIGPARLFFGMLSECLFHSVTPTHYCRHQLYLHGGRDIDDYLFGNEAGVLFPQLNEDPTSDQVDDKEKFYDMCTHNSIPIPRIFGIVGKGVDVPVFPEEDIVVKPVRGSKGIGVELWRFRDGIYVGPEGDTLNARALGEKLRARIEAGSSRMILQSRLINHDRLLNLSKNALITARIVTYRTGNSRYSGLNSSLIISLNDCFAGSKQAVAPVQGETGRLGSAVPYGVVRKEFSEHPVSGEPIVGTIVPFWNEALSLAIRAHSFFPGFFSLGWDIAITDDGPIVLEANKIWDIETAQRPNRTPIGHTDFAVQAAGSLRRKNK